MAGTGEDLPGAAAEALASPRRCPHCEALSVIYDYTQGISACEECGHVENAANLVPQRFASSAPGTAPTGVFVAGKDSGVGAARAMLGSGRGLRLLGARPDEALHRVGRRLAALCDGLALTQPVRRQAEACVERLKNEGTGNWRAEEVVVAAAYYAIRTNNLPLTLLDVAAASQVDVYTIGRSYRAACAMLGEETPYVNPADLLPRSISRVMAGSGGAAAAVADRIRVDAAAALLWMQRHLKGGSGHPIVAAAAAIVLALDMNNVRLFQKENAIVLSFNFSTLSDLLSLFFCAQVDVGQDYVAETLNLSASALRTRLRKVREALLGFGALLPYSTDALTTKSVTSHARSIMRLTNVLEKKKEGEKGSESEKEASVSPGPASAAFMAVQVAAAAQKSEEDANAPPTAKRRRRRKGEEQKEEAGAAAGAVAVVDELTDTIPDDEMHQYLRSGAEVDLYKQVYDALHPKN
jgi:transcription initiation factor TFIIIB Brf1 subunit/transcription initiation factor TFIIB